MKAMIFAAGLGTRLRPLTDSKPKALVKVGNTTLLELAILQLKKYNINQIIVNVYHFADQIIDFLNDNNNFGIDITISDERNKLLDTGGGLKNCKDYFHGNEPFLIYNVDILSDINLDEMLKIHIASKSIVTLAVRNRETSRYLLFDENDILCGWKNIQTGEILNSRNVQTGLNFYAFSGIHIVSPEIFQYMPDDEVFSVIKLYLELSKNHIISCYNHDDSAWLDVGKPDSLQQAEEFLN